MIVTKEGIYKDEMGTELPIFNVGAKAGYNHFRAYWMGGYYNVNDESEEMEVKGRKITIGQREWEMVEFVRDFEIDKDGHKI